MGNAKRAFASTVANQYSSRSHAILQLLVEVEKANMQKTCSKLYVIDLAGSEKIQTLNCSKKMLEGANINKSLLALGNCINLLA
jgi:kinesin family protein 18/19